MPFDWNERNFAKLVVVTVGLFGGMVAEARADVTWLIQPSSSLTFGGTFTNVLIRNSLDGEGNPEDFSWQAYAGDVNGVPQFVDVNSSADLAAKGVVTYGKFTAVPQTDKGGSGDPALGAKAVNSTITTISGHFSTVGTTFLSSLDLGGQNADLNVTPISDFNSKLATKNVQIGNNGNWLPDAISAGPEPGIYSEFGAFSKGNAAFTLAPVAGASFPYGTFSDGTGGRVILFGTAGDLASPKVNGTDQTIPVDGTGHFNPHLVSLIGSLGFAANYVGANDAIVNGFPSQYSIVQSLPPLLVSSLLGSGSISGSTAKFGAVENTVDSNVATITRGALASADQYKFIMTVPFQTGLAALLPAPINLDPIEVSAPGIFLEIGFTSTQISTALLRPGNINFDNIVDISDVQTVAGKWMSTNANRVGAGDANGDGVVDISDIQMIAANWMQPNPTLGGGGGDVTAVPEPSALVLLSLGTLALWAIRRRARR